MTSERDSQPFLPGLSIEYLKTQENNDRALSSDELNDHRSRSEQVKNGANSTC